MDLLLDIGFDQLELSNFWDKDVEVKDEDFNVEEEIGKYQRHLIPK